MRPPGFSPVVCMRALKIAGSNPSVRVSSRKIASCEPSITTRNICFLFSATFSSLFRNRNRCVLEPVFHPRQPPGPVGAEFGRPPVVDHVDRHGVEEELALAPDLLRDDQV